MSAYYNDLSHPQACIDLQALHALAKQKQVSWALHFLEASNLWYVEISSAAPTENLITRDHSLSISFDVARGHLEKL